MKRDSVVIYRNLYEALQGVSDKAYKRIMNAILKYSLDGEITELNGVENSVFQLAKTQIDANNRKYENGKKGAEFGNLGGRPKREKPQENPTETPNKPLNDKCKMINDNYLEVSKKESKEENNLNINQCVRESYDEIIKDFEFSKPVENKVRSFLKYLHFNKMPLTNDEFNSVLVELDMRYEDDGAKITALEDAMRGNFKALRRVDNVAGKAL